MTATAHALQLAKAAANAAEEKIADKVTAIDVSDQMPLTDIFVIASAASERQIGSIGRRCGAGLEADPARG